jgi:DMSO/TMAO reductase YedYZ molybdopterin-dependent catalytic subunit
MRLYPHDGHMFDDVEGDVLASAGLAGVAGVLGSYAVAGFTPEFVAAPITSFLSRTMPAAVLRFAITVLGDLGQKLNLLSGIGIAAIGIGLVAYLGIRLGRRLGGPLRVTLAPGVLVAGTVWLVTGALGSGLGAGVAAAAVVGFGESGAVPATTAGKARRRLLRSAGALAGAGALAAYLGPRRTSALGNDPDDGEDPDVSGTVTPADVMARDEVEAAVSDRLDTAEERSLGVNGIEPLVSENFYEVDINAVNPTPQVGDWELRVTGAVESEQSYTFADLASLEPEHRFVTLRCVGESLNGNKMDNALWTGVPMGPLLDRANLQGEYVMLRAVDDYFEEFPVEALRRGFLAYGMNGDRLPRRHGYPVRALIPGHWGEINVKWLDEIEILRQEKKGYWEQRGWHGTGPVKTVAKIKAVNRVGGNQVQVGGHAYAGTRGISAVEVSTDGGDTWTEADLSEALPAEDAWRQWTHVYESPGSKHEVVARAIEADGRIQPNKESSSFPSGPSGWVSRTVR